MDTETDLFVQAFWVKCRDIIRPEFDEAVDALRGAGHEANVATLEFSPDEADNADAAPAMVLTVRPKGSDAAPALHVRGDVVAKDVVIVSALETPRRYDLAQVDLAVVKRELATTFATLLPAK
ncbi:hypothetical protein [Reyranella sp.]|uniref:hypothetical protein n=1 Tax=Reyranella sp. TaxID=1929291 RepID=UPI00120DF86D|nr:hypothetical protein [Reyranella sp.]TAJ81522.1 MAG: hypothetical protein EPO50_29795 [Reyranella sp.]